MSEVQSLVIELQKIIDKMQNASIIQVITTICVVGTLILGVINIICSLHKGRVDGITNKRVEWINEVRSVAAEILQYDPRSYGEGPDRERAKIDVIKNAYRLNILLNVMRPFDGVILEYLCDYVSTIKIGITQNDVIRDKFVKSKRRLKLTIQIYLKSEWNRVKHENKITFKKYDEDTELEKLLDKFPADNTNIQEIKQDFKDYIDNKKVFCRDFVELLDCKVDVSSGTNHINADLTVIHTPPTT